MRKNQARTYQVMALLKKPCHECQQVWAYVKGTSRKRESTKCITRGHKLTGVAATTHIPFRELMRLERLKETRKESS